MLQLDIQAYRLPFRRPFVTAFGRFEQRRGWLVRIVDAKGLSGFGEAAPLPGFGGGESAAVESALNTLGTAVEDLADAPTSVADLAGWTRKRIAEHPGLLREAPAALAGIELALADLAARRADLPLARWLIAGADPFTSIAHPAPRDPASADSTEAEPIPASIPVNATIGGDAPADCAAAARRALDEGYRSLKLKLTGDDALDLERARAVHDQIVTSTSFASGSSLDPNREELGGATHPPATIRLDANGSWSEERALRMLQRLAPLAIDYVEQPSPVHGDAARDLNTLHRIHDASPLPIAADEILLDPDQAQRVVDTRAADLLILKPSLLGGPTTTLALASRARLAGLDIVITSALDAAIGRLGALHLAAALRARRPCGLATGALLARDLAQFPDVQAGRLRVPTGPGLGVQVQAP